MPQKLFSLFLTLVLSLSLAVAPCWAEFDIDTASPFLDTEYSKKISMDFEDADLVDVLKIFSEQTRYNLITAESISDKRVTVYLDKVPVEQALEQVLRANDLTYELQPNSDIYIVKPVTKPDAELLTRVYPLKYASVTKAKLISALDIQTDSSGGGGGGSSRVTGNAGIVEAVNGILTDKGDVVEDTRTNSLIVTDVISNFPRIEKTIARLDVKVPQILIEVEMLEVSKDTSDQLGIKPGGTLLSFSGAVQRHLYPFDQNFYERKGQIEFSAEPGDDSENRWLSGEINFSGLSAALQFLHKKTDTKTLARPRILTLNNETAQIKIATDEAIGEKTVTAGVEGMTSSSTEAERVETGVFLTVTPQANIETNEIIMAVIPRVVVARASQVKSTDFRDPEERTSQSILKVKSGETIVIGGLLRQETTSIETKTPILGDIPFIGRAFRHNDESFEERELIIFLTPHILEETPATAIAENRPEPVMPAPQFIIREQQPPMQRSEAVNRELAIRERKRL